jgi:hypothetical protein
MRHIKVELSHDCYQGRCYGLVPSSPKAFVPTRCHSSKLGELISCFQPDGLILCLTEMFTYAAAAIEHSRTPLL